MADIANTSGIEVAKRSGPQTLTAVVLLATYAAIPIVGFAVGLEQVITHPSHRISAGPLTWFLEALSSEGGAAAQLLPKLLLPLTAVLTGASIDRVRTTSVLSLLFVIPLLGVLASLGMAVLFEMASSVDVTHKPIVALGYEMATNLSTYLMLTLGLQAAGRKGS